MEDSPLLRRIPVGSKTHFALSYLNNKENINSFPIQSGRPTSFFSLQNPIFKHLESLGISRVSVGILSCALFSLQRKYNQSPPKLTCRMTVGFIFPFKFNIKENISGEINEVVQTLRRQP